MRRLADPTIHYLVLPGAALLAALLLAGCEAGNGEGLDLNGRPIDENRTDIGADPTSFEAIQQTIFTPMCTVCHSGAAAPLGVQLDAGKSYSNLVGVASVQVPELLRVRPGESASSYLMHKLEGTSAVGDRMPLGSSPLSSEALAAVRAWIDAGAPQTSNPPADPEAPLTVVSTIPVDGSALDALPGTVAATFSHDLDPGSISTDSFALFRSGGDGSFLEGNEVQVLEAAPAVSPDNPRIAFLDLASAPAIDDTYQVRMMGSGVAVISDQRGEVLDGDGDGAAGGDAASRFTVDSTVQGSPGESAWQVIQNNVLTPACAVCHAGAGAPEGLRLDAANSYAMLVGVQSAQVPGLLRVAPGDADNSYLIQKLEGTAASGAQMPRGSPPLPQATIDYIRQWIANGALQTDSDSQPPPPPPPPPAEELLPTWRSIQDNVFTPICIECHIGADAPADLILDEQNSFALLVNQRSDEDNDILRVAPGNPDQSYLVHVLEGTAPDTPRMPFGRSPLPDATIQVIREWIATGANP